MKNIGKGFLNIIVFTVGLALLIWAFGAMQVNRSDWPSVDGQIVSSTGNLTSDEGSESSTYEYIVDGTKYTDTSAEGGYSVGETVTVYYDPADPADSTDDRGGEKFFAIACFVIGLWIVGSRAWDLFKAIRAAKQPDMAG